MDTSIAVQTYGDFLNHNPHLHAIVSDGCFLEDGSFRMALGFILEDLEEAFQYEVLKMLKKEGKINDVIIENMLSWYHSGFHVYIGDRIEPDDKAGLGNLARYIIRACFSQERMAYVPAKKSDDGVAKVIYTSKDGKSRKVFNALDWLARLVTHIPGRYEHTVRCQKPPPEVGACNVNRSKRLLTSLNQTNSFADQASYPLPRAS